MTTFLRLKPRSHVHPKLIYLFYCLLFLFWTGASAFADTTVGGTISTDTTWTVADSPYIVTTNITVIGTDGTDGITTLTIEPGVVVKFNSSRYMGIGASSGNPGALIAQGTETDPIVFTSNQADPAPGDWYYIRFNNSTDDATTVMEYCVVEYGGGTDYYSLYLNKASPTFRHVTVQNSGNYGAYLPSSDPVFDNCTFTGNQNYDLFYTGTVSGSVTDTTFNSGISLLATTTVAFSGNTFNQNNDLPIKAYADNVGDIVNGNTFANVDSDSFLEVSADTIEHDAVWTAAIPYAITGNISVLGMDGDDAVTTLTIEPGATLKFGSSRYMVIGANSGNSGALIAQGTETDPIVFTSNQADPSPGDWYYIRFNNNTDDATTVMEYCVVEYGGGTDYYSLYLNKASPTFRHVTVQNSGNYGAYLSSSSPVIENCTFTGNQNYDLFYTGTVSGTVTDNTFNSGISLLATTTVSFSGNTFNQNNDLPIQAYADSVGDIVYGNTLTNVDSASYLEVTVGTIEHDALWSAAIPYAVIPKGYTYAITVQGTDGDDEVTTLTIEPGAVIKFDSNLYMNIGYSSGSPGALVAQGTEAEPIVFTSSQTNPATGDWRQIAIYDTADDSTVLDHCTFKYAGSGSAGQVYVKNAAPTISNCTFSDSGNYDLYYYGTVGGTVSNCTLNNGVYLLATSTVDFFGNTFNYNNSYPIKAYADNVGDIAYGNTFNNIDAASYLEVTAGTIKHDAIWSASIPYAIVLNGYTYFVTVQGTDGDDEVTTLTIEPGAVIKFDSNLCMNIGYSSGSPGALVAQGTEAEPIVFTSNQSSPAPGDWRQITIYDTADDSTVLDHCTFKYAGSTSTGQVHVKNAAPTISNCTFSDSGNYDLYYYGTVGGTVSNCTLNNGVYLLATSTVDFSGNTFNYNTSYPIKAYADNVGDIAYGNTFNNIDASSYLEVTADTIEHDATWTASIPYSITGNITVQGTDGDDDVTTLTIAPGATLKFKSSCSMTIGASSGGPGALIAQGTTNNMILFTSNQASPAAGDWNNICFYTTTDATTTIMDYCVVDYGGYSSGALYLYNAAPTIQNSTIRNSGTAGIYAAGNDSATASINCNTFTANQNGIYWTADSATGIQNNNFSGNTNYGIYYSASNTLDAENNWWGDAAGPNQSGDATYGNVDADPWSTEENDCTGTVENQPPYEPSYPTPDDTEVRVSTDSGVTLSWSGGDPNPLDTVTYDLYWGTTSDSLQLAVADLSQATYTQASVSQGLTYYWQIIARDNYGAETTGPVWHFTADGDSPDLIVSQVTTDPAGNLQSGQSVTFTATIQNTGSGPVVDAFSVDFQVDAVSIGTTTVDQVLLAGENVQVSSSWTYTGGDPTITLIADDQEQVTETDETNNSFSATLFTIADNSAPVLVSTTPAVDGFVQTLGQITVTLMDALGTVDDTAVMSSFTVIDSTQQSVSGTISEADDTFTFVPDSLPLEDDTYTVNLTATDTYGNTQNHSFNFTVDSEPPGKPVITGGTVTSGTIQARPVENITDQFVVELTGTRDADTAVLINGVERVGLGDEQWSVQIELQPGENALEANLKDRAGNIGEIEWVDIQMQTGTEVNYEYDAAGRIKDIYPNQ